MKQLNKSKSSEKKERTAIMVGDIVIMNNAKQTLKIKRGSETLSFEVFSFNSTHIVEFNKEERKLSAYHGTSLIIDDLFGIILSVLNLTAKRLATESTNPDEEFWMIEKYPEDK